MGNIARLLPYRVAGNKYHQFRGIINDDAVPNVKTIKQYRESTSKYMLGRCKRADNLISKCLAYRSGKYIYERTVQLNERNNNHYPAYLNLWQEYTAAGVMPKFSILNAWRYNCIVGLDPPLQPELAAIVLGTVAHDTYGAPQLQSHTFIDYNRLNQMRFRRMFDDPNLNTPWMDVNATSWTDAYGNKFQWSFTSAEQLHRPCTFPLSLSANFNYGCPHYPDPRTGTHTLGYLNGGPNDDYTAFIVNWQIIWPDGYGWIWGVSMAGSPAKRFATGGYAYYDAKFPLDGYSNDVYCPSGLISNWTWNVYCWACNAVIGSVTITP